MSNKNINGPVNTIRLEGKIGNIKKVIYIFMDFHARVQWQTECDNIRKKDIDTFLVDTFDELYKTKKDKVYDLFIERNPMFPFYVHYGADPYYKGPYLFMQLHKLFHQASNIDPETGEVFRSNELKNVRLHYADIRGVTTGRLRKIEDEFERIVGDFKHNESLDYKNLLLLYDGLKLLHADIGYFYDYIYNNKNFEKPIKAPIVFSKNQIILSSYSDEEYDKIAKKYVYKIIKSYNDNNIKKIINHIIGEELHEQFKLFFEKSDVINKHLIELLNIYEPYKDNLRLMYHTLRQQPDKTYQYGLSSKFKMDNIIKLDELSKINSANYTGYIGLYLMDLYLLRRILDKKYITNAIVYTGATHSNNYIRILVKYFNFHITHYSYLKDNDIDKAEKYIKNSKNINDLNILFYPPVFKQCSVLNNFPVMFE
jgi:hypothetical protein